MKFISIVLALTLTACSGYESQRPTLHSSTEKYQGSKTGDAEGESGNETGTTTNPTVPDGTAMDPVTTPPVVSPDPTPDPVKPGKGIESLNLLVFSKTGGYRHGYSIEEGIKAMKALGVKYGFKVDATEDSAQFTKENLAKYSVVFFLNTTGEILDDSQRAAFEGYIKAGGGYVGAHAAADTLYTWPYYEKIVGAWFGGHPAIQKAKVKVEDNKNISTSFFAAVLEREDEWYNYKTNPRPNVTVLMSLDESSYQGGSMKGDHPITWCHEIDGGRAWYSGFGHTKETFTNPDTVKLFMGGILWAANITTVKLKD